MVVVVPFLPKGPAVERDHGGFNGLVRLDTELGQNAAVVIIVVVISVVIVIIPVVAIIVVIVIALNRTTRKLWYKHILGCTPF